MKREIKFRGKRLDNGRWEIGDFVHVKGGSLILPIGKGWDQHRVDPETVGQFTGLKDKMDETYSRIQSCVMLSAPERAYNIVLALVRIIGSLNKELTCRYDFAPARELAAIPPMLSDCEIKDYGIDNILNVNIK